ncbi:MAG: hypothetical protein KME04_09480 [Pleurocapsa minor GSE-CHR-MK-17-07R]|jgi:hypothetical protein|nr:hypothetical protein [Pleurocapsa minor GSE-CHR-MK 17-07R]
MTDVDARHMLDVVTQAYAVNDYKAPNVLAYMHALAEAQDQPARDFMAACLSDERPDWTLYCLTNIGFHYDLRNDTSILETIRHLLRSSADVDVRICAASVLGIRSTWPDETVHTALFSDPDDWVRSSAFEAILRMNHVPHFEARSLGEQVFTDNAKSDTTFDIEKALSILRNRLPELGF